MAAFLRKGIMAKNNMKSSIMPLLNEARGINTISKTLPKMKAYANANAPAAEGDPHPSKGKSSSSSSSSSTKKANNVPLYVALGMIGLSVGLGLYTAKHQFMHAPAVRVKKSGREIVSEVDHPERVARESEDFIKKSFFRRVANVQEFENPVDDPIHVNPLTREAKAESLKSAGVNPAAGANEQ